MAAILVVRVSTGADPNDTNLINFLTGRGHTVTDVADTSALPDSGYDLAIITDSGSATSAAITSIPTCLLPVMLFETRWDTARMSSAAAGPSGSGTQYDLTTHAVNSGYADPLTTNTGAQSFYGVADTTLPAGVQVIAYAQAVAGHSVCVYADAGATLTSGTAPNRRCCMGLITSRIGGMVNSAPDWFEDVILLTATGGSISANLGLVTGVGTALPMTVVKYRKTQWALSITPQLGAGGGQNINVGQATSAGSALPMTVRKNPQIVNLGVATSPGVAQTITPDTGVDLPALIDGVEPESHSYAPVLQDTNGNLYRITESTLAERNQPRAMKSTDQGQTWTEQDNLNRPGRADSAFPGSIADLESAWVLQGTGTITFVWQRNFGAWSQFRTSDHATNPDTWVSGTRENVYNVDADTNAYGSVTKPADQAYQWLFFNNAPGSGSIFRSRTSSGTYGSITTVDSTGRNVAAMLGPGNVSHLIYKGTGTIQYRTLSSTGTLSGATRVDTNGTHSVAIPHAAPMVYTVGGNTYVGVLFGNGSAALKFVLITNGTPGSEETVTASAVTTNPDITVNEGVVCTLSVEPDGTLHAIWSDSATGNLMHSERPHGGAWTTPDTLYVAAGTDIVMWTYSNMVVHNGTRFLAYTYDVGPHADDDSNIWYNRINLGAASGGPQNINLGLATSAGTAQPIAARKTKALPVATETDAGQTPARVKRRVQPVAVETDTALAPARSKRATVPVVAATDAAQTLARSKRRAVPLTAETETALAPARRKTRVLPVITETDLARPITEPGAQVQALPVALETDAALAPARSKRASVPAAAETDAGQALARRHTRGVTSASETDAALAAARSHSRTLTSAGETNLATTWARGKRRTTPVAAQTDTAVSFTGTITRQAAPATETDAAQTAARSKRKTLPTAVETDTALAPARRHVRALPLAAQTDTAVTIRTPGKMAPAPETDAARPVTRVKSRTLPVAVETDATWPMVRGARSKPLPVAVESEQAVLLGAVSRRLLVVAVELDAARTLGRVRVRPLPLVTEDEHAVDFGGAESAPIYRHTGSRVVQNGSAATVTRSRAGAAITTRTNGATQT